MQTIMKSIKKKKNNWRKNHAGTSDFVEKRNCREILEDLYIQIEIEKSHSGAFYSVSIVE